MQTFVRGVGVFLLACLIAVAILLVGQALWGGLVLTNLKASPTIPWAAVVMIPLLAAMVMSLGGIGWPKAGAETRRRLVCVWANLRLARATAPSPAPLAMTVAHPAPA
jgi:hypothetical protein